MIRRLFEAHVICDKCGVTALIKFAGTDFGLNWISRFHMPSGWRSVEEPGVGGLPAISHYCYSCATEKGLE